ncbi:lactonase [Acidipila sp. EB88]|nr:lactonase [Acidipila sp. EB88]
MSNAANKNEIVAYHQVLGSYIEVKRFATGGRGSGGTIDPLQSQGSLVVTHDAGFLLAANAGSGTISVFRVNEGTLTLTDQVPSGGSEPLSIAELSNQVYVLNGAGAGNVTTFQLTAGGHLEPSGGAPKYLSGAGAGGSSIAISPDGKELAVTERNTNSIDIFPLQGGVLQTLVTVPSKDPGVFSARFTPNRQLVVSETGPANTTGQAAISSYAVSPSGSLAPITQGLPTYGSADCWNAITPNGKWVYASNAASSTISGFSLQPNGVLLPIGSTIVGNNPPGSANLDITTSTDGRYLFSLNAGTGTISVFVIQGDGTLQLAGELDGLPSSAGLNGIAAL